MGNLRAAMEGYMKILTREPTNADALYYVAVVAAQEGQHAESIKLAQRALSFGPPQARLHNLLGQSHFRLGQVREALDQYNRAIALQPDFADAFGNRANVLSNLGRHEAALADYDRALALREKSPEDWSNRGAVLQDLDRNDEALESYERALALKPDFSGAHYNRGNILRDRAQSEDARAGANGASAGHASFEAALAGYNKAISLNPQFAEAFVGRAIVHLLRGDWEQGFRDFEHRTKSGPPTFVPLPHPYWDGKPLTGERLVLVTEQGLGDTINFCRFGPLLAARGFDVTILTKAALAPLLSALPGVKIATSADQLAQDPRPIRWLPLMSVAGALGIRPQTVPASVPYLSAEPERIAAWAARLGAGRFKIGINWTSGHSDNLHFLKRNIPLAAFAPLAALPNVQLFSLQKGPAANQIAQVAFRDKIELLDADPNPDADLFLDTAAAMTQLDLVITCDTSVAHLAGALARPVFTLLPVVADWRWLLGRDDSPWYPTMRLFRQSAPGDWPEVMTRIAHAVQIKMSAPPAPLPPPASR
jgi:tetratricopeptide (TPR) repeat protein